jgi:hypothetical protein
VESLAFERQALQSDSFVMIAACYDLFVPKILAVHQILIKKHKLSIDVEYFDFLLEMPQGYTQHNNFLILSLMYPPYFNIALELILPVKDRGLI